MVEQSPEALQAPAATGVAVTPSNTVDIAATRALYVGGAGDVKVDMLDSGTAVIFAGVPAGSVIPIRVTRVYVADTTATSIVALY